MRATIPASDVDNSYAVFPEGLYNGQIATAEIRDVKDGWQTLKIAVEEVTPRDETQPSPGRTKFQSDITLKTDGVSVFEVGDFSSPDLPFGIRKAAGLLAGLAEGLGVATRENGQVVADLKSVAEALVAGEFKGEKIGFEVKHYKPKGKDKTYDQYNRFGPAA